MKDILITVDGAICKVSGKALTTPEYGRYKGRLIVDGNPVIAGQIIKQYVKQKFPQIVVWVQSDKFSMGNSLNVYLSQKDGSMVSADSFDKIKQLTKKFVFGKFDGMTDSYEYFESAGLVSDCGVPIEAGVKYVIVSNRPKFGSVEWCLWQITNGATLDSLKSDVPEDVYERVLSKLI